MRRLDKSIEDLTESYIKYGLVNFSGGELLPSTQGVKAIVAGIEELVFPGFREDKAIDRDDLLLTTSEKVYRTARELIGEVEKSLSFAAKKGTSSYTGGKDSCHDDAEIIVENFFDELPRLRVLLADDISAAFRGDPAAKTIEEVIVSYPGFEAIAVHRFANFFWKAGVPLIPRMMSELVHSQTGIDIHPGAEIGESFFIDHGTGIVIGETTVIGKNVKLYQGVTLGALSVKKIEADHKRHPTIEDDVTIYANATILGGETVIGRGSVIGGSVWITESVPPNSKIYVKAGDQASLQKE
ncbi:serine acetyltransferase [Spirochaetia bacterium]|nr:serine acetyltransferase [Spirochaetia bacterium]